ncbi:type II toxin-antitoxin system VapC family toxin [Azospirillum sp. sgz301742]
MVVDTSALMAIILDEPEAEECMACLEAAETLVMSAGTLAEALIVAERCNVRAEMERLVSGLGLDIVTVTLAAARQVADAYARWGKGVHPASLNYGDCFAYALAHERNIPLLYVGDDFSRTDVGTALLG